MPPFKGDKDRPSSCGSRFILLQRLSGTVFIEAMAPLMSFLVVGPIFALVQRGDRSQGCVRSFGGVFGGGTGRVFGSGAVSRDEGSRIASHERDRHGQVKAHG